ncbi:MAG: helix-turn-helix domain-containing protein [Acidobacteriales bacterium]|nr:helix-turn-helix domain-containing protein [Terriglobales bacterium]
MYFQTLQTRLVAAVRMRVRTGELTERRLARLTGISQPHIHNVLKGARELSPEIADLILRGLKISLLDLLECEEIDARASLRHVPQRYREVPLLDGRIDPGQRFPDGVSPVEFYPFPGVMLASLDRPLAARLARDPQMRSAIAGGDLVLLDQSEGPRREADADSLYVVSRNDEGIVRWVRQGDRSVYLATTDSFLHPSDWEHVPLGERHVLEVVKARIAWIGRETACGMRWLPDQDLPATSR